MLIPEFKMRPCFLGLMFLITDVAVTCGADKPRDAGMPVECCGKLHCNMVAPGGEHTGTSVTFCRGIHWELKFSDARSRAFAKQHEKEAVLVIGTLRRVPGVERRERWIVDVTQISEPKAAAAKDMTTITVRGVLRIPNAVAGNVAPLVLEADGFEWALDFPQNPVLENRANSLAGKSVEIQGQIDSIPGTRRPVQMKICVDKLSTPAAE